MIDGLLRRLPAPDAEAADAVRRRAREVLRPRGALERLDEVAAWLAGWQRTPEPTVARPACVVFVADHGVAAESVSAYPAEVTSQMLWALRSGVATASAMCRELGVHLEVVDVGVGEPTANIRRADAMTAARFADRFEAGRDAVVRLDEADLLVLGEMGIGNTTAASAVCATVFGGGAEEWTGRGTGIDEDAHAHKVAVVEQARSRVGEVPAIEALRRLGGSELAAIAGAIVEARRRSIPVVLDGFVVTAACAALEATQPGALDHCIAGHCSGEPGHRLVLSKLGKEPLLDLGLRLGEASGALAAVPLVRLAAACVRDVATFEEL